MRLLTAARARPKDRVQSETDKAAASVPAKLPAPVGGWVESRGLSADNPKSARVMENIFPTTQGVRIRGGSTKVATIGARAKSIFTYQTAATAKIFASTASAVYDISAFNPASVPAAAISGLTSGYFSTEQMGTVGGEFLYIVNGTDSPRLFDGSTWTTITGVSSPAITGVTTSLLSYVWKHKNRLWFVEKNTRRAWYLPVDSVGGAAASVSLAGVFQKGGSLLCGTTWSQDAGDGMDDRVAFISTEGEVAIYQGSNPASAADWALVGVYSMAAPRGMKCHAKAGGDVIIGTDDGAVPLSAVQNKDPAALSTSAVSAAIETSWRKETRLWDGVQPWEMVKWPRENMLLLSLPHEQKTCFVANIQTGAWAKYIGWDVQCATVFNGQLYFADRSGFVYSAETGGSDNGTGYTAKLAYMPSDLAAPALMKSVGAMRGVFHAIGTPTVQLSLAADYAVTFPAVPSVTAPPAGSGALWDVAVWDVALWDDDGLGDYVTRPVFSTGWTAVGAQGFAIAPQMQMVINGSGRPNVELIQIDLLIETGGIIV